MGARCGASILNAFVDAQPMDATLNRIVNWARAFQSRYVVISNAHVVVSAWRDPEYCSVINDADMATPDGAPVAWSLRRLGFASQRRICGPDLTRELCDICSMESLPVYFYGSDQATLASLEERLLTTFPRLLIAGLESPPFRALTADEDAAAVRRINASGACIVFVGLGCPKQERWMSMHRGEVHAVMIGVGAAFDFLAGTKARAPIWMQRVGLEWLYRLLSEPRRLWKRYLVTNFLFIVGITKQLITRKI